MFKYTRRKPFYFHNNYICTTSKTVKLLLLLLFITDLHALCADSAHWHHSWKRDVKLSMSICILQVVKAEWLATLSWIAMVAVLSHHIRDATRRGLWLWPLGSTPPIPYFGYIFLLALLPLITAYVIVQPSTYSKMVDIV